MKFLKFPNDFLFGSATAAYQIEGGNVNSDWWAWEREYAGKPNGPREMSGFACDSYNRYKEDFKFAQELNHNVHRMSIEWGRIEPQEGKFNEEEIEHYRNVLKSIKSHGMKTFVTLWHFTLPQWLREQKGWGNFKTPYYFARYATLIAERLGEDIDFFITFNEPHVYLALRHVIKIWIPYKHSTFLDFFEGWFGILKGHKEAVKAIKKVNHTFKVGICENIMCIEPKRAVWWNYILCELRKLFQHKIFLHFALKNCDFIGINYYFHDVVGIRNFFLKKDSLENKRGEVSDWGWEIYPEGIYKVVKEIAKFKKPIYITENGIADATDTKRESFIVRHLYWLHKAIDEGIDVRGYIYWTLLDNFEWAEGYIRKFGLIEVDRSHNLDRKIRPSAYTYAKICKEGGITRDLQEKYNLS